MGAVDINAEWRRTAVQPAHCHVSGTYGACIGILGSRNVRIVIAVVGVLHAHSLLNVELATLLLYADDDGMAHQTCEFLGQSCVVGREADAGVSGIGNAQVFAIARVEAVVVGHDYLFAVNGDADDVAEREPSSRHVGFCHVQHGCAELVIR